MIGIVASRIAERHHRPAVLIALDGDEGTGSGRSIPAFDLLGGLDAASADLLRHGGHRAAAGLTIARGRVDAFREAFVAHAAATLRPEDLVPVQRVDAVVPGDALHLGLAEELQRLAPFGMGNPEPALLVPSALLDDPRGIGEGRHVAFTLAAGGARSRCVAFGRGSSLPAPPGEPVDAAVRLEVNRYNGAVEPRLVLRHAQPACAAPIEVVGEPDFTAALAAELHADLAAWPPPELARLAPLRGAGGLGGPRSGRPAAGAGRFRRPRGRLDGRGRPATARSATCAAGHRRPARRPRRRRGARARGRGARGAPRRGAARPRRRLRAHHVERARGRSGARRAPRTSSRSTRPPTRTCARSPSSCRARAGPTSRGAAPRRRSRGAC